MRTDVATPTGGTLLNVNLAIPPRVELWESVAQAVRLAIIRGDLPAGSRLVEADISERLNVSRGPVRDALRQLELELLVESLPRRGMVVRGLTAADVREVYELRILLETHAARRAAGLANEEDLDCLSARVAEMHTLLTDGRRQDLGAPDIAFHRRLVEMSGQRRLVMAWEPSAGLVQSLLSITDSVYNDMTWAVEHHQQIIDALRRADADTADRLVREHLGVGRDILLKALQSRGVAEG